MSDLQSKIQSFRQTFSGGYRKPEPSLVEEYSGNLELHKDAWKYLTQERKFTPEQIAKFKLGYDPKRNAISIPVYRGDDLVNIRYRHLDPNAPSKYTQEGGCEVWLYNDSAIDPKKALLIVEGEFDLIAADQAGVERVVSPVSGKDSYGPWVELLDVVPKVYIAYDNDEAGKVAASKLADRIGVDKTYRVQYPDGIKDANDFFKEHTINDFRELVKEAEPFYKQKYAGVGDVIDAMMKKPEPRLQLDCVPFVKWKSNWLAVVSAMSGFGKTTYAMNIANELAEKEIPTLILPFERGIKDVGERFIHVRYNKNEDDLMYMDEEGWAKIKKDAVELPIYFSLPTQDDFWDTVKRAKRLFGVQFIIVDHLDYFIDGRDAVQKQSDFMKRLKEFCIAEDIAAIVVHHVGKGEKRRTRKLVLDDLKGSTTIHQVAEVVILMYPGDDDVVVVEVAKNKGETGKMDAKVDMRTGRFRKVQNLTAAKIMKLEAEIEKQWEGAD